MICVAVPDDVMQIVPLHRHLQRNQSNHHVTGLYAALFFVSSFVTLNMTNQEKKRKNQKGKLVHWQLERSQSPV